MPSLPLFNGVFEIDANTLLVVRPPGGVYPGGWKIITTVSHYVRPEQVFQAKSVWPMIVGLCELKTAGGLSVFTGIGPVEYIGEPVEATVRHKLATLI